MTFENPKAFDGGRIAYVSDLTFGRARINYGDKYSVYDQW